MRFAFIDAWKEAHATFCKKVASYAMCLQILLGL